MHTRDLDEKPYIEYLAGRALRKVSPKRRHGIVQLAIGRELQDCSRGYGSVATEWRFHLDVRNVRQTTLVPDVAFVKYERLNALPPAEREEPPFAPDIAIEIRSPSDRTATIDWKVDAYLRFGGTLVFDVLIDEREIRVTDRERITTTFRDGESVTHPAFPWLRIDVRSVFAEIQE